MSTRAKWIIALALLILVGLWVATLATLRPLTTSDLYEVRYAT